MQHSPWSCRMHPPISLFENTGDEYTEQVKTNTAFSGQNMSVSESVGELFNCVHVESVQRIVNQRWQPRATTQERSSCAGPCFWRVHLKAKTGSKKRPTAVKTAMRMCGCASPNPSAFKKPPRQGAVSWMSTISGPSSFAENGTETTTEIPVDFAKWHLWHTCTVRTCCQRGDSDHAKIACTICGDRP